MLPRALVHDCFTQDPADRSGGEEGCAKRFVGCERIGNFEDAGFGALAIRFRSFVFLYALVQLPGGTIDLPGRDQSFKLISNREGFLKRFPRALQIAISDGYSRLQIPSERLQIRIDGGQCGLQKMEGCGACVHDISGQEPGIAQFKLCHHSPGPMHEKFCAHLKVLYALEMFERLRVFPLMERYISGGHLVNRVVLSVRILSPRVTARLANSPCTLKVESQCAKPCFAESK